MKTCDGSAAVASASDTGSINRLASIDSFDSKWLVPRVVFCLKKLRPLDHFAS